MKNRRGNILFLILLAIVLFVALTYAINSGMRGGGKDASNEKAQAQVADLLNYFAQIDAAVQRMMVIGGLKDYELNFYYQFASNYIYGSNDNTNCTASRCRVFDPAGGGVIGQSLARFNRTNTATSERLMYLSIPGAGTDLPDIVFRIEGAATKICQEVNKKIGLPDMIYNINVGTDSSTTLMYQNALPVGSFPASTLTLTGVPIEVGNKGTFCTCPYATEALCETTSPARPNIYHVILAR